MSFSCYLINWGVFEIWLEIFKIKYCIIKKIWKFDFLKEWVVEMFCFFFFIIFRLKESKLVIVKMKLKLMNLFFYFFKI